MAEIITMPRLSDTMTSGVVTQWFKKVGDKISEGDILAEIKTDKATIEFESFNQGTLLYIGIKDGENAPVDSLLAIIGNESDDIDVIIRNFKEKNFKQKNKNMNGFNIMKLVYLVMPDSTTELLAEKDVLESRIREAITDGNNKGYFVKSITPLTDISYSDNEIIGSITSYILIVFEKK